MRFADYFVMDRERRRKQRLISSLVLLLAILGNAGYWWWVWNQTTNTIEVDARAVRVVPDDRSRTPNDDALVVRFANEDGREESALVADYGDHDAGDEVRIRYVPPARSYVLLADQPVARPLIVVLFGLGLVASVVWGVIVWRVARDPFGPSPPRRR